MDANRKPRWWSLYVLVPLLVGLLFASAWLPIPDAWQPAVQVAALLLVFALILTWLSRNTHALLNEGRTRRNAGSDGERGTPKWTRR